MRVEQARGGTNRIGVTHDAFAMPPGMRMRYDVPASHLAACVTGYAVYISDHPEPMVNWYLPGPAIISILLDAGRVAVSIRNRSYPSVDQATVYGPTSKALHTVTHGGIAVFIGLTAEGWSRFTEAQARDFLNTVVPLSSFVGEESAGRLVAALEALGDDAQIADVLDQHLPALFQRTITAEHEIRRLSELLLTDGTIDLQTVADAIGLAPHTMRRVALRHFGLTPKPLLTRARFLRSYIRWLGAGESPSYRGIDSSYYDPSHFIRDSNVYLDTTPRRFSRLETIFLRASLRARAAVLGAPTHALYVQDHQATRA